MDPGKKGVDDAIIMGLATGLSAPQAAAKAGCSERTVRRRLESAEFRAQVDTTRARMVEAAVEKLSASGKLAVRTLRLLAKSSTSDSVKLGAARGILEYMLKAHEIHTVARQVEQLQQQLESMRNGTG